MGVSSPCPRRGRLDFVEEHQELCKIMASLKAWKQVMKNLVRDVRKAMGEVDKTAEALFTKRQSEPPQPVKNAIAEAGAGAKKRKQATVRSSPTDSSMVSLLALTWDVAVRATSKVGIYDGVALLPSTADPPWQVPAFKAQLNGFVAEFMASAEYRSEKGRGAMPGVLDEGVCEYLRQCVGMTDVEYKITTSELEHALGKNSKALSKMDGLLNANVLVCWAMAPNKCFGGLEFLAFPAIKVMG